MNVVSSTVYSSGKTNAVLVLLAHFDLDFHPAAGKKYPRSSNVALGAGMQAPPLYHDSDELAK